MPLFFEQDVTEVRAREAALGEARERLQLVTDTMAADEVARCSKDQRYLWVSRAYAAKRGRTVEEVVGRTVQEVLGEAAAASIQPRRRDDPRRPSSPHREQRPAASACQTSTDDGAPRAKGCDCGVTMAFMGTSLLALRLTLVLVAAVAAGEILGEAPAAPDPAARYLFYLHGRILEDQGRDAVSPDFGRYEYDAILKALAASGATVIGEVREKDAGEPFVRRLVAQVRRLRGAGVPARNIALVGASKGGLLALQAAAAIGERDLPVVVLAGCGRATVEIAARLKGRVLSIHDRADRYRPSCAATFAAALQLTESRETVLDLKLDHGLLYTPHDGWLRPTLEWIGQPPSSTRSR